MTTRGGGKELKRQMNISIRSLFGVWNLWRTLENNRNKYSLSAREGFSWRSRKSQQKAEKWKSSVPLDCTSASNLSTLHCQLREKRPEEEKGKVREKMKDCVTCMCMHPWAQDRSSHTGRSCPYELSPHRATVWTGSWRGVRSATGTWVLHSCKCQCCAYPCLSLVIIMADIPIVKSLCML